MEYPKQLGVLRAWSGCWWRAFCSPAGPRTSSRATLPKVYEGKVSLIVGQSIQVRQPGLNELLASQRLSQTYADLATTGPLLSRSSPRTASGSRRTNSGSESSPMRLASRRWSS